ncbi:MAG TPA: adenylate/guanylate cyclase domain-containing protein [Gaiellaceae bacterium]|nr:adenylate/guanylate cyclase domain-containing protein [Gaiellaceae bacterium]
MRQDLPTGTVTFLFTDVEASTRLLGELGAEGYAEALEAHRRVIRGVLSAHGGVEVDTQGDAFFCAFASARDAVTAAAAIRDGLEDGPIRVRIGVHTGEALVADAHYVGLDVHRAARIGAVGHGGQVVLSPSTVSLLEPGAAELVELGEHRLKDLSAPVRLRQLGAGRFPPLKTLHRTNLPVPATPFLGREHELQELVELASGAGTRLLTLTGPGGSGKTRLALQLAAELADGRPGGVFWVPLAPVRDPELVPAEIARSLGVVPEAGLSLEGAIADRLARSTTLLLLDNCEHLVSGVAAAVAPLLAAAPSLLVLATSREPLAIAGEREAPVDPMRPADAVDLFVERARAIRPDFGPDAAVERIVERLDRLPLAVELAAARIRALPPAALLERLDRALPLLTGGRRDAEERQRTLRAAIAWSVDLLDDQERGLLARLGGFAGGARLDAVEAVAGGELDTLESLVAKSLVRVRQDADGEPRYWLLETIREYAIELLEATGDDDSVRASHAHWFTALVADIGPGLRDRRQREALGRIDDELDNVRVALAGATARGECETVAAAAWELVQYWDIRGLFDEAIRVAEESLAACGASPRPDARLHYVLGFFQARIADSEAGASLEQAALRFRDAEDSDGEGLAWAALAFETMIAGRFEPALELAERAVRLTQHGDPWARSWVENVLAMALQEVGRHRQSTAALESALGILERLGDGYNAAILRLNLAENATAAGDYPAAREHLAAGLGEAERLGTRMLVGAARVNRVQIELRAGSYADAAELLVAALRLDLPDQREQMELLLTAAVTSAAHGQSDAAIRCWAAAERAGAGRWLAAPTVRPTVEELLAPLRTTVEPGRFDELWAEGASLEPDAALQTALAIAEELAAANA